MIVINGRLPLHSRTMRRFVKFLNNEVKTKRTVVIHGHQDRNLVDENKTSTLYGIYINDHVFLALGGLDESMALLVAAHEIYHAIQHQRGQKLNEQKADHFATQRVLQFREYERTC